MSAQYQVNRMNRTGWQNVETDEVYAAVELMFPGKEEQTLGRMETEDLIVAANGSLYRLNAIDAPQAAQQPSR